MIARPVPPPQPARESVGVVAGCSGSGPVAASRFSRRQKPVSIHVASFGTGAIPDEHIASLIRDSFPLSPAGIIDDLRLRRPIYRKSASYGHFGREEAEFRWESTHRAAGLRAAAGLDGEPPPAPQL